MQALAEADSQKEAKVGIGKAMAIEEQVRAYGGPQLQLVQDVMSRVAQAVENAGLQVVPTTVVTMGGDGDGQNSPNAFNLLMTLLATEKLAAASEGAKLAEARPGAGRGGSRDQGVDPPFHREGHVTRAPRRAGGGHGRVGSAAAPRHESDE